VILIENFSFGEKDLHEEYLQEIPERIMNLIGA
jgi:hypothetical protein